MGQADYLRLGDWNARCDRCGKKVKGSELRQMWNGLQVCAEHWEPRQPQDFVRSIQEHPTPPFVRNPPDTVIPIVEALILEGPDSAMLFLEQEYILSEAGGDDYLISEGA